MSDVGGSWWDQVDPGRRARGNGVALVDRVAVAIDQARGIEMGPPIDRTAATIFDDARPKYDASVFVGGLEFQPDIIGIDGATGKEVSHVAGADDKINTGLLASSESHVGAIEGGPHRRQFAASPSSAADGHGRFFPCGKGRGQVRCRRVVQGQRRRCRC